MPLLVWEVHGFLLDQLVHLRIILGASVEGREADDHLVREDAKGPPIDGEGVTALDKDLRCQVVGRSAEGVSLGVALEDLSQTEVREADVPIFVHQDVLRLQVTVDDVLRVEMAQCHGDLDRVEAGTLLWETGHLSEMHEEFTTTDESHDEENLLLSLEHVAHTDKEGVIGLKQDVLFESSRLNLVVLNDHVLSE